MSPITRSRVLRRLAVVAGVCCVASAVFSNAAVAGDGYPIPERRHGRSELKRIDGVPVLFLQGTPEDIGRQHGTLIGNDADDLLKFPQQFLKRAGQQRQWPLIAAAGKLLLLRAGTDHRRELQAAIRASGQDADALIVANTMLELRRMGGCSSLIVDKARSKTGNVLFGRNFDFPPMGVLDKYGLVSVYRPAGKRAFVSVGYPGLVGVVSGMNDAGLCVATLDVYSSKDGSPRFDPTGTPMMFTFRRLLEECRSVEEAEQLLRQSRSKATTWMNLAVCDKNGGVVFELTPKSVVARKPVKGLLSCTNHFRTRRLCTSKSCRRYDRLVESRKLAKLGIADVSRLLHAANQKSWTIQTMIFEPAAGKLHVSLKKPPTSTGPLTTLDVPQLLRHRVRNKKPVSPLRR